MKIIHCADLHLDSSMSRLPEKAPERRAELLSTFKRMINYARENSVDAIIIAGDLFDTKNVSATAKNAVRDAITGNPQIDFYYLRGNHDADSFLAALEVLPSNLRLFGDDWTAYAKGGIKITGAEMTGDHRRLCSSLELSADDINIVVLHGQVTESTAKNAEDIDLRELRSRGIDYLALGHIHAYREWPLDSRGCCCYPGCVEGRGFDECGEHGFVLLSIDEEKKTIESQFIPFARRRLFTVNTDISGLTKTTEIEEAVRAAIGDCTSDDLLKIVLTGEVDVECEKNLTQLETDLRDSFYFVKVTDETGLKIDYNDFEHDISLKGEFVRAVKARDDLSDGEKAAVIRYGLKALSGEEVC